MSDLAYADVMQRLQEDFDASFSATIDVQTYVMLWGLQPGEDYVATIETDNAGVVGFCSFRHGFIPSWCNWEWEDIGLCRPLAA